MAPPTILGRSQSLYPERSRLRQRLSGLWNGMFPNGVVGPTPGGGAVTAATGVPHRAPNSYAEYAGSPLFPNGIAGPVPGGGSATAATGVPYRAPNSMSEYLWGAAPTGQMPFRRGFQPFPRGGASAFPGPSRGAGLAGKQRSPLYGQSMLETDMDALMAGLARQYGSSLSPGMRADRDAFMDGSKVLLPDVIGGPKGQGPVPIPNAPMGPPTVGRVNLAARQQMPLYGQSMLPGESPDLMGKRQMPLYGQSMLPELNDQLLNGQGPLRRFGREGLSPLFNIPPQSPYRPGSAPGMSVLGAGEMALQDSVQATIDQIRFDRENLRDMRMRQGELKQGQFDETWGDYATQAPLMNQRVSPNFGQTAQGLGPGGVAPMTPEEQAFMARRNAYTDQPGTSQMYDRFGGGPLTGEALRGVAPSAFNNDYDGQVRMQVGGYGSPLSGPLGKSRDPEFSDEAVAQRQQERMKRVREQQVWNGEGGLPPGANPRLRQARKDIDDRREAMGLRRSDDMRGRIADRDAARAERLRSGQAQNLSRRGISPLSAEGQSLAPDLYGSLRAQRSGAPAADVGSPLTAADGTPIKPVPQTGPRSVTAAQKARTASHAMLSQRPVFRALGIDAGATPDDMPAPWQVIQQVNDGVTAQNLLMSPQEIQQLHEYAVQTYQADPKAFSGEGATSVPEQEAMGMWSALAQMPLDRPDQRQQWWGRYQAWLNRPKAAPAVRPYFSDPRSAL